MIVVTRHQFLLMFGRRKKQSAAGQRHNNAYIRIKLRFGHHILDEVNNSAAGDSRRCDVSSSSPSSQDIYMRTSIKVQYAYFGEQMVRCSVQSVLILKKGN